MYGDLDAREPIWLTVPYASANDHPDIEPQLPSIRANYAGLVTMVDTWFGRLLDTIDRVGLRDNTLVVFLSDHGTNFADNAERVLGKPAHSLYPGTMDIPLIIRSPGMPSGQVVDELVTTLDVPATVLAAAEANGDAAGRDLRAPIDRQEYVTCRYGNFAWYRDVDTWFFSRVDFADPKVFDLNDDPECTTNIADRAADRIARASARLLADAGGPMPLYRRRSVTDAIGRPQFDAE
jgi:arylsulfatase A-like enzyme